MASTRHHSATFRDLLRDVADANAAALMRRARLANRIAKSSEQRGRRNAYRVKVNALEALHRRFPERVELVADPMLPKFLVVAVPTARFGLHAPADQFASGGTPCAA